MAMTEPRTSIVPLTRPRLLRNACSNWSAPISPLVMTTVPSTHAVPTRQMIAIPAPTWPLSPPRSVRSRKRLRIRATLLRKAAGQSRRHPFQRQNQTGSSLLPVSPLAFPLTGSFGELGNQTARSSRAPTPKRPQQFLSEKRCSGFNKNNDSSVSLLQTVARRSLCWAAGSRLRHRVGACSCVTACCRLRNGRFSPRFAAGRCRHWFRRARAWPIP
jgi:hypothetical protein